MLFLMIPSFMVLICIDSSYGTNIHEQMTPEEIQSVFRTSHDNVPEYEVVPISHGIHENSPRNSPHRILHFKSFKRDIRLYLEPTEGLLAAEDMPIWMAKSDRNSPLGLKYTKIPNVKDNSTHFYQDPYNYAAFASTYDKHGQLLFEGTIGDDIVVRALPVRLRKSHSRIKRSIYDDDFSQSNRTIYHPNLNYTYHHIVYKQQNVSMHTIREKMTNYIVKNERSRFKRSTKKYNPKIIYPQILVILEYNEYLALGNVPEIKRYVISFWNAVDLRYRIFRNPVVRLNIAGIIIGTEPGATPYIQKSLIRGKDVQRLDADKALNQMGQYFYNELANKSISRFVIDVNYDIAILMTRLNLCNVESDNSNYNCFTLGYAFRAGACSGNVKDETILAVGLVEDNGGYLGIVPAAHEIGHLMGAPHDGHMQSGKTTCPKTDGYIMAGMLTLNKNVFKWSSCSLEYFEEFFHSERATCLYNRPLKNKNSKAVPRILPGHILTLHEQCDRIAGTRACNTNESACIKLECEVLNDRKQCRALAPAAEGSPCGIRRHCINGKCINRKATQVTLEYALPPKLFDSEKTVPTSITVERN